MRYSCLDSRQAETKQKIHSVFDCQHQTNFKVSGHYTVIFPAEVKYIYRGADKSLARPTSLCRKTELIMSLERGVCSSAELQVFSCYRG